MKIPGYHEILANGGVVENTTYAHFIGEYER